MYSYPAFMALAGTLALVSTPPAFAQEGKRFSYEIEIEAGVDSIFRSSVPGGKLTDTYFSAEAALAYRFSENVSAFAGLTLESVLAPAGSRVVGELGLYLDSVGLEFALSETSVVVGKFAPAFGLAPDTAPGFYGNVFAEDYELGEAVGLSVNMPVGPGDLTVAVFYADNTMFSRSLGTDRGRNHVSAGGIGNTGKLNNFAAQYEVEQGNTRYAFGASLLSAGVGDVKSQKGLAVGVVHAPSQTLEILGEIAAFDGYGGANDRATYATFGTAYARDAWTYSASYTARDIRSTGTDHLVSLGLDYTFANDVTLSSGLGWVKDAGNTSTSFGVALIIPFGG